MITGETEALKIQGANKSDHNTLCLTLQIKHTKETAKVTWWKIKKGDGWKDLKKKSKIRIERHKN